MPESKDKLIYMQFAYESADAAKGTCPWNAKRIFDFSLAILSLALLGIPMFLIALVIRLTSRGPALYWSDRVGRDNVIFRMPKFRTMRVGAPVVATHLMTDAQRYLTPAGYIIRKYSLDELPQLISILQGKMSFVGPRPALFNQYDLIELRSQKGVQVLTPGLTGWAQINGRDDLPIPVKVNFDEYYLKNRSFLFDLRIIIRTFSKVINCESIRF